MRSYAMVGSTRIATMRQNSQFTPPFDLRIFAIAAGLWSLGLAASAISYSANVIGDSLIGIDPMRAIFAGVRFAGGGAQLVLFVEAGILAAISAGVLAGRRWGLLLALFFMAETVIGHLALALTYTAFGNEGLAEWIAVRRIALQGPTLVMITLYLWIRASDLIFDPLPDEPARAATAQHRPPSVSSGQVSSQVSAQ